METLSLEELWTLPQEELIAKLIAENQERVKLAERVKEVESWAVKAATELNQTKKELEEKTKQIQAPQFTPEQVSEIVEQTLNKKEADRKISTVAKQLPDSMQEQFIKQYKEIVWDRNIPAAEIDKFINATLAIVAPDVKQIPEASLAIWRWQTGESANLSNEKRKEQEQIAAKFFGNL